MEQKEFEENIEHYKPFCRMIMNDGEVVAIIETYIPQTVERIVLFRKRYWEVYYVKTVIAITLSVLLLFGTVPYKSVDILSTWAEPSVKALKVKGYLRDEAFMNYRGNITREAFIYLAVRLYEVLGDKEIEVDESIIFTDTDDIYARKAATVSITNGVGSGAFGADDLLTREQLAVFMVKVLDLLEIEMKAIDSEEFTDNNDISDWAKVAIYKAKANGIILGIGEGKVDPKGYASTEVALILINRMLNTYDKRRVDETGDSMSTKTIFINQIGYLPKETKYFITDSTSSSFVISSNDYEEEVFRGLLKMRIQDDPATGMTLFEGDFTEFNVPGDYTIKLSDETKSYPFQIKSDVYNEVRNAALKSFYFQRSGIEIKEAYAGMFKRPAGHVNDLKYHKSTAFSGSKDVSGGWYDAGDFGRYMVSGSVSVGLMLMGYEQYPEKFDFDNNTIPESFNGVPDVLDEIRYELEWMLKMQHLEGEFRGAVHYMVNSLEYVWELPHVESESQYIYGVSTVATADFAAVMAMASRVYQRTDETFAKECLQASELAWFFLENRESYPPGGFKNPEDTFTGGYGMNAADNLDDEDDRLWAAVELFLTTGNGKYNEYVLNNMDDLTEFSRRMDWEETLGFAHMQYLLGTQKDINLELQEKLERLLVELSDDMILGIENDGFYSSLKIDDYLWGSNGEILIRAEYLIFAYLKTGETKYYDGALSQLNYVLGSNGNNTSFVTDYGTQFSKNIHHSTLATDDVDEVYPGMVAGGPNYKIDEDPILYALFTENTPPALCYSDHIESYASNENCIMYVAPLVPVAAFFSE